MAGRAEQPSVQFGQPRENPRGIGLVDLVYALEEGRKPRASGEMALHSLEVMECILKSAHEHVFCEPTTTFEQPKPLDWQ